MNGGKLKGLAAAMQSTPHGCSVFFSFTGRYRTWVGIPVDALTTTLERAEPEKAALRPETAEPEKDAKLAMMSKLCFFERG